MHVKSEGCIDDLALVVECFVAHFALSTTHDLRLIRSLILEGDSLEVISLLLDLHGVTPWVISELIQGCFSLIRTFDCFTCNHVKRCANSVAYQLTKYGMISKTLVGWFVVPPLRLKQDLYFDVAALV